MESDVRLQDPDLVRCTETKLNDLGKLPDKRENRRLNFIITSTQGINDIDSLQLSLFLSFLFYINFSP